MNMDRFWFCWCLRLRCSLLLTRRQASRGRCRRRSSSQFLGGRRCCCAQLVRLNGAIHSLGTRPSRIRPRRQHLHLLLPDHFLLLLQQRRRIFSHMPQPLVPLGRDLHGARVRASRVLDDPSHADAVAGPRIGHGSRLAVPEIVEFPVRVAIKVAAYVVSDVRRSRRSRRSRRVEAVGTSSTRGRTEQELTG